MPYRTLPLALPPGLLQSEAKPSDLFPCLQDERRMKALIALLSEACQQEEIYLSAATLARWFQVDFHALRMRLDRWRWRADREPLRDDDRRKGRSKLYYNLRDVLPVLRELERKSGLVSRLAVKQRSLSEIN